MILLGVITTLGLTFAARAKTEPTMSNQLEAAQAQALADSGLQVALWALSNPTQPQGLDPSTLTHDGRPVHGTYDGAHFVPVGTTGGFTVQVTWPEGNARGERTVTVVGWTPSKDAEHANTHRKVQAIVQMGAVPPLDPPCVLCVAGEVQASGNTQLDSSVGGCSGATPPVHAVRTVQAMSTSGAVRLNGHGTTGAAAATTTSDASQFKYTADALATLKAVAQENGTYYRGHRTALPASGIVFIDTTDGSEFTSRTPSRAAGSLSLAGRGTFTGIVIVAGSAQISGDYHVNGLVYALNDLALSGNVRVDGAVVSENRKDTSSTVLDSGANGHVQLTYNCANVRTTLLSSAWRFKPGAYLAVAEN